MNEIVVRPVWNLLVLSQQLDRLKEVATGAMTPGGSITCCIDSYKYLLYTVHINFSSWNFIFKAINLPLFLVSAVDSSHHDPKQTQSLANMIQDKPQWLANMIQDKPQSLTKTINSH